MAELTLTSDNFDSTIEDAKKNRLPVLVDFWATWCGPCRMLAPFVEEVADELNGKLIVGKINVDDEPELANRFGIMSIPTLLLIQSGEIQDTVVGYVPKASLLEFLRKNGVN